MKKLPSEDFMFPIQRYNDAVGPIFAEFRGRFPLTDYERSLRHSLGIFLNYAYRNAVAQMEKLKPVPVRDREEWINTPDEIKELHMNWQRNLRYLKQRNYHFLKLLSPNANRVSDNNDFD